MRLYLRKTTCFARYSSSNPPQETSPIFGSPPHSPPAAPSPSKRQRTPEKQVQRSSPPKPTPVKGILSPRKARPAGETPKKVPARYFM